MSKIRALIVDDSSVMRKIVERSLRQADIELEEVFEASNGAEALETLRSHSVDLVLCDINMPVMDGLEFVRQVATIETAKGVPISFTSAEMGAFKNREQRIRELQEELELVSARTARFSDTGVFSAVYH